MLHLNNYCNEEVVLLFIVNFSCFMFYIDRMWSCKWMKFPPFLSLFSFSPSSLQLFKEELTQVKDGMKHINDLAHQLAISDVHLSMENARALEQLNSKWKLLQVDNTFLVSSQGGGHWVGEGCELCFNVWFLCVCVSGWKWDNCWNSYPVSVLIYLGPTHLDAMHFKVEFGWILQIHIGLLPHQLITFACN